MPRSRSLLWLTLAQFITATLGAVGSFIMPTAPPIRWVMSGAWLISAFFFASVFVQGRLSRASRKIASLLMANPVRAFAVVLVLIGGTFVGLAAMVSRNPIQLPPLPYYLVFILLWPWLTLRVLTALARPGLVGARKVVGNTQKGCLLLIISLIALEGTLQVAYTALPTSITEAMPQDAFRQGIHDSPLGLPQYSAGKVVYTMDGFSGNLGSEVCPTTAAAAPRTVVSYNRDDKGFRNVMPWPDHADVIVVGDSMVAGEAVQHPFWDGLSPSLLELGLPGTGQIEQTILLNAYGFPRTPKVVIMAYYEGNDLADNWSFQALVGQGMTRYDEIVRNAQPWDFLVSYHLLTWLTDKLFVKPVDNCAHEVTDQFKRGLIFGGFDTSLLTINKDILANSQVFGVTRDAILKAAQETHAAGATFVLLFETSKAHSYWHSVVAANQTVKASWNVTALQPDPAAGLVPDPFVNTPDAVAERLILNMDAQRQLLTQLADQNNFLMLDLTPTFQAAADAGQTLYLYGDGHWNQAGHDLIRTTLHDFLVAHNLIP